MTHIRSRKSVGFGTLSLHRKREPHPIHYLKQRGSFWVAVLSLFTFLIGNMMGQHGFHAFYASVIGAGSDSLIVYTGTVPPVERVPDYTRWIRYGGNPLQHTFRQVPENLLVSLPRYNAAHSNEEAIFSVGHMGSYHTGEDGSGSHPGVDIRLPSGTPIIAIANGIVDDVKEGSGFGKTIVIRHPNVPNPDNPSEVTTLYSSYAHLSAFLVSEGMIVQKGETIAYSGSSGFVSGPHLHFQIGRDDAPWHPYWPFTGSEARAEGMTTVEAVDAGLHQERGYEYTVNPLLYVQANYKPVAQPTTIASAVETDSNSEEADVEVAEVQPVTRVPIRRTLRRASADRETLDVSDLLRLSPRPRIGTRPTRILVATMENSRVAAAERRTEAITNRQASTGLLSRSEQRRHERLVRRQPQQVEVARGEPVSIAPPAATVQPERTTVLSMQYVATSDTRTITAAAPENVAHVEFRHDGYFVPRDWERVRITLVDTNGDVVTNPLLNGHLILRTVYGEAEFRPATLSEGDFEGGTAEVYVLARQRRTVVLKLDPFPDISLPLQYLRNR